MDAKGGACCSPARLYRGTCSGPGDSFSAASAESAKDTQLSVAHTASRTAQCACRKAQGTPARPDAPEQHAGQSLRARQSRAGAPCGSAAVRARRGGAGGGGLGSTWPGSEWLLQATFPPRPCGALRPWARSSCAPAKPAPVDARPSRRFRERTRAAKHVSRARKRGQPLPVAKPARVDPRPPRRASGRIRASSREDWRINQELYLPRQSASAQGRAARQEPGVAPCAAAAGGGSVGREACGSAPRLDIGASPAGSFAPITGYICSDNWIYLLR